MKIQNNMHHDLAFEKREGKHYFTVSTARGNYSHEIQYLSMTWSQRHMRKIGLNPNIIIPEIVSAYLKWRKKEKQQIAHSR